MICRIEAFKSIADRRLNKIYWFRRKKTWNSFMLLLFESIIWFDEIWILFINKFINENLVFIQSRIQWIKLKGASRKKNSYPTFVSICFQVKPPHVKNTFYKQIQNLVKYKKLGRRTLKIVKREKTGSVWWRKENILGG
jgi:hypothetical protein